MCRSTTDAIPKRSHSRLKIDSKCAVVMSPCVNRTVERHRKEKITATINTTAASRAGGKSKQTRLQFSIPCAVFAVLCELVPVDNCSRVQESTQKTYIDQNEVTI